MTQRSSVDRFCPVHGLDWQRATCRACNAAYMSKYMRDRRRENPGLSMWHRAKQRADRMNLPFDLPRGSIQVPERCPVLDVPLIVGEKRAACSPALDRIVPVRGYVVGNCRVISDWANRLKGDLDLVQLKLRAEGAAERLKGDYAKVVAYVDREELLLEVKHKAAAAGRAGAEWAKIAAWLERRFATGKFD